HGSRERLDATVHLRGRLAARGADEFPAFELADVRFRSRADTVCEGSQGRLYQVCGRHYDQLSKGLSKANPRYDSVRHPTCARAGPDRAWPQKAADLTAPPTAARDGPGRESDDATAALGAAKAARRGPPTPDRASSDNDGRTVARLASARSDDSRRPRTRRMI